MHHRFIGHTIDFPDHLTTPDPFSNHDDGGDHGSVLGKDVLKGIIDNVRAGHNVVLLANHQVRDRLEEGTSSSRRSRSSSSSSRRNGLRLR